MGVGHIGRRHASLVAAHPGAFVTALLDVKPRADIDWPRGVSPEIGYVQLTDWPDSVSPFPEDTRVVSVCTPNGTHASVAALALDHGLHVVLEKPMTLAADNCARLVRTAAEKDLHVFGVMQNRFSPASRWLKAQLAAGSLGRIYQVHVNCFWNRDDRYYRVGDRPHPWHGDAALDGGVLYTQFAHFVDLLYWGFGEPEVLGARFANQAHHGTHDFPDTGMVHLAWPGGALGSLNFSTAIYDRNFESTLTVIGARGTIKLGGQYMNELRYCHVAGLEAPRLPPSQPGNDYGGYVGSAANHHFVVDNVVEVLNGRAEVACTGAEGLAVVRIIEAIYAAGGA